MGGYFAEEFSNLVNTFRKDENYDKNAIEKLMLKINKLEEENHDLKEINKEQQENLREFMKILNTYKMNTPLLLAELEKFKCKTITSVKTKNKDYNGGVNEFICTYTQKGHIDQNGDCTYDQPEENCELGKRIQGCVPGDHMILLDDNTWHPIADLKPGQKYFNGNEAVTIHEVEAGFEEKQLIEIEISVGDKVLTYDYTQNHVFPVTRRHNDVHLTAKDLKVGDLLTYFNRDKDNYVLETQVYVTAVRQIPGGIHVYNIRSTSSSKIWEDHYMIGNGIVSGNLNLQEFVATVNGK